MSTHDVTPGLACHVITNVHRGEFLIGDADDRNVIVSLSGEPLGPVFVESTTGDLVALLTNDPVVVLGQFQNKAVYARDWQTGATLWTSSGHHEIGDVMCTNINTVMVRGLGGICTEVDGRSGKALASIDNVSSMSCDSASSAVVAMRGRAGVRYNESRRLEFRHGLRSTPVFSVPCETEWFDQVAFGDGWLGIPETVCGGRLITVNHSGRTLWEYRVPSPGDNVWCSCSTPDRRELLVIIRDQAGIGEHRIPDRAILFDGMTGRVVRETRLPQLAGNAPAMHGSLIIGVRGLLHVPSLVWEPRLFRVPDEDDRPRHV